MENVEYRRDRENIADSGFHLPGNAYLVLEQFAGKCFSDPSLCTAGMSVSFYVKLDTVTDDQVTLVRLVFYLILTNF